MRGPTSGAQRASSGRRVRRVLFGAIVAAAIMSPGLLSAPGQPFAPQAASASLSHELYYLSLVNCTRTGGWVLGDGSCRGYGSGHYSTYVKPLTRSPGISDRASRPYAKLLAIRAKCSHFLDGDPGYRLRRAGFSGTAWGENIGCRDGYSSVNAAILASHLVFQSEKSSNGGHWRNIKNPKYTYIGIGIYRYNGRVRLVTDFYRP